MGKYCDICKTNNEERWIEVFECSVHLVDWCDFSFHVCKDCALKIKEAIEKVKNPELIDGDKE